MKKGLSSPSFQYYALRKERLLQTFSSQTPSFQRVPFGSKVNRTARTICTNLYVYLPGTSSTRSMYFVLLWTSATLSREKEGAGRDANIFLCSLILIFIFLAQMPLDDPFPETLE